MRSPRVLGFVGALGVLTLPIALLTTGTAEAAPVTGVNVLYTTDADFEQGDPQDVNHDAPNTDQLQLDRGQTHFKYVHVAASARGTMLRIDAETGKIVGEWWTAPANRGKDPSRTTVDRLGNVWVSNRAEGTGGRGSVARIGVIDGGTRVNADGSANSVGDFLKPPFNYSTCEDRNHDGLIATSHGRDETSGLVDIRPWLNASGVDDDGGVETAVDECIIAYTRTLGTNVRTVAVDANNDVWVGGHTNKVHQKLSGVDGSPIAGTEFSLGCGGYGGLVDKNGVLWSANSPNGPLRYDPVTRTGQCLSAVLGDYGLGTDSSTGEIWHTNHTGNRVVKVGPGGDLRGIYQHGDNYAQGVVVDGKGNVWVANSLYSTTVGHLRTSGAFVGTIPVGNGPTGIAVDRNDKIWVTNYHSDTAMRIDPDGGPLGADGVTHVGAVDKTVHLGAGARPYNYSDMTGSVLGEITAPIGTWSVTQDAGRDQAVWGKVTWNTESPGVVPDGTSLTVEARTADTEAALPDQPFVPVTSGTEFSLRGRFIEVRATFLASNNGASPVLSDLRVQTTNEPPAVEAGADVAGDEGAAITLHGTVSDPDEGDPLATTWSYQPVSGTDEGAVCTFGDDSAVDTSVTCTDDGVYEVILTADDGQEPRSDTARVTVANVAPDVTGVTAPGSPVPLGTAVSVTGTFGDPGANDTHTAIWDWGDGTAATPGDAADGTADPAAHTFGAPGVYTVCLTVTDDDRGSDRACSPSYIVVYDQGAGFVTGGGWFTSPSGAHTPGDQGDPDLTGRASFGFVAKYRKGATVPDGNTEFQFHAADLNFHSDSYDWLVVAGTKAIYKGTGTVGGESGYRFMVSAVDGGRSAAEDRFRIRIWSVDTGAVLYDNQVGGGDDVPASTVLGGGAVVIHR